MVSSSIIRAQTFSFEACLNQTNTAIEQAYCEVKKRNANSTLPALKEFKKNTPSIQRLILKREAEYYGVALPKNNAAPKAASPAPNIQKPSRALSQCEFRGDYIACESMRYELVRNKRNSQLRSQAFSSENTLSFPSKESGTYQAESDFSYLSAIYPTYIYKMLDIGLGDSTMSFTKFATLYWQSKKDEHSFSDRFETIYNQLKIEKSRNQVRERYSSALPDALNKCTRMDNDIIICDNAKQNWVYKLR